MNRTHYFGWGCFTIALCLLGTRGAIAQTPVLSVEPLTALVAIAERPVAQVPAVESEAAIAFETFTLPQHFLIDMPVGWVASGNEAAGSAMIASFAAATDAPAPDDIKTEIVVVDEPPNVFVERELDTLIEQEYVLDRYGITSVGGNDAFRVWIVQLPGDFAQQVITFVGSANGQTAKIVSSFNDSSQATKDTILQMHSSFQFVTAAE